MSRNRDLNEWMATIKRERQDNLKILADYTFGELKHLKYRYWGEVEYYRDRNNEKMGEIYYEIYSQFFEAEQIKRGNEEEIWDSLT